MTWMRQNLRAPCSCTVSAPRYASVCVVHHTPMCPATSEATQGNAVTDVDVDVCCRSPRTSCRNNSGRSACWRATKQASTRYAEWDTVLALREIVCRPGGDARICCGVRRCGSHATKPACPPAKLCVRHPAFLAIVYSTDSIPRVCVAVAVCVCAAVRYEVAESAGAAVKWFNGQGESTSHLLRVALSHALSTLPSQSSSAPRFAWLTERR